MLFRGVWVVWGIHVPVASDERVDHLSIQGVFSRRVGRSFASSIHGVWPTFLWTNGGYQAHELSRVEEFPDPPRDAGSSLGSSRLGVSQDTPLFIGDDRIIQVKPIGCQEVYDFEVEEYHNYTACGMVHHNTVLGSFAVAVWMTGLYPSWWEGKVFDGPVKAWAINDTATNTRDINQFELLGSSEEIGTGMIPKDLIIKNKPKPSVADAYEVTYVKHVPSGRPSILWYKSYDQKRLRFTGRAMDVIWPDEEIPPDIREECLLRTMTTGGRILYTYTPVMGLTPVTVEFLKKSVNKLSLPKEIQMTDTGLITDMDQIEQEYQELVGGLAA